MKADLERRQPMDRLVCGDVGYGKTEVAMRAALKVALDGHQVAVLVPTTILAEQHWNTFRERFGPYPVRVEMLSRFRSAVQQKAVLAGLAAGTVDVVIGTHRLLSKDVAFKDLGLLIVDEEHRFGVGHKERLKQLRKTVHVLTLTATPIPRTLSMAMAGIRDLSVIESPPADRLAVETTVCRFDARVIKEAIERELGRGGQVFVVHNRIQSLPALVRFIARLVPRARIAMAHGQMRETTLERTMLDYVAGAYDVLVATAIIESGLDIPASNTIIINRADRLGLAQLYQLRGRVGRDRLQAYAYLLIPADGRVDETAAKRLRVIQELTALGSGLKIALRDMEIRGAGNLLGAQQHGQIEMVGFDLYLKLLEEAVRELRGDPVEDEVDPVVTVDAAAYLPEDYVAEPAQRLALYKRLAGIGSDGRDRRCPAGAQGSVRPASRGGRAAARRRGAPARRQGPPSRAARGAREGTRSSRSRRARRCRPSGSSTCCGSTGGGSGPCGSSCSRPRSPEGPGRRPSRPSPGSSASSEDRRRHADEQGAARARGARGGGSAWRVQGAGGAAPARSVGERRRPGGRRGAAADPGQPGRDRSGGGRGQRGRRHDVRSAGGDRPLPP